jgi:hypothetical protein
MVQTTEDTRKNLSATTASEDEVTYEDVARALRRLPKNKPLPDAPEVRKAVLDLFIEMYRPALKELEKS